MANNRSIVLTGVILILASYFAPDITGAAGPNNLKPHILNLKINNRKPLKMDLYEITFTTEERFDNPYDPGQVEVIAGFTTPAKKIEYSNGFWYEGFSRSRSNGFETLTPDGAKAWKIRYTPRIPGKYQFYIELIHIFTGIIYIIIIFQSKLFLKEWM
jgi:hypothetical protein